MAGQTQHTGGRAAPADGDAVRPNGQSFFRNTACTYFPCHEGVDPANFNCLFCYCPLYALGEQCGGNFRYSEKGVKDCTACTMLHVGDAGAAIVKSKFEALSALARPTSPQ